MKTYKGRPQLLIEREGIDRFLDLLGVSALIFLIIYPLINYGQLPEEFPRHFTDGKVDAYGPKPMVWLMPALGALLYLGLRYLTRIPHRFNYAVKITDENAHQQYKIGSRMIRAVNTMVVLLISFASYMSIEIALGRTQELSPYFDILFVTGLFAVVAYYFYKSVKSP